MKAAHGMPSDFLDRCLIIRTLPYTTEEVHKVIAMRCKTENIPLSPEAHSYLAELGSKTSLRYVLQLLSPALVLSQCMARSSVSKEDIEEANSL
jgi:RuvB-like protein 1 (pontin 52)